MKILVSFRSCSNVVTVADCTVDDIPNSASSRIEETQCVSQHDVG